MVGVICSEHRNDVKSRIKQRQKGGNSGGNIRFQDIKIVTTNCVKIIEKKNLYNDILLIRG